MGQYVKPLLMTAVGVIIGLIVYDMFVKNMVGNFEQQNYEVDDAGNIMKIAA